VHGLFTPPALTLLLLARAELGSEAKVLNRLALGVLARATGFVPV